MKLRLKYFVAVNIGFCTVGVISILIGIINGGMIARPLLESLGIGLIAAGAVNILDRAITLAPQPLPLSRIEVVAETRLTIPESILDSKYKAAKVDLIGISLTHFLEEQIDDPRHKIINRLLFNNLRLRVYMVHPDSKYLEQRAHEDKWEISELVRRQKKGVELCVKFYEQLHNAYQTARQNGTLNTHLTGKLQIKLLDFCPYLTIYRIDEQDIYWGIYTSDTSGINLPLFKTSASIDPALHKNLHQHIHGLMERDLKYPDLVSMPEMGEPVLNQKLVSEILRAA